MSIFKRIFSSIAIGSSLMGCADSKISDSSGIGIALEPFFSGNDLFLVFQLNGVEGVERFTGGSVATTHSHSISVNSEGKIEVTVSFDNQPADFDLTLTGEVENGVPISKRFSVKMNRTPTSAVEFPLFMYDRTHIWTSGVRFTTVSGL